MDQIDSINNIIYQPIKNQILNDTLRSHSKIEYSNQEIRLTIFLYDFIVTLS